ncbi:type II secretion system F family protein [Microaerobacter geothermalis]|uniref:type II secretion system F family protein n=1 Tax=Microaerobacter geothermalis TaxID=674972 RepID=UPI001F3D9AFE|nr:type II secretion system F family protein [Microaerobacter geothermalis]MCF6094210.1 type II secretion system F family protein [Microaerobacter geothermalis]
MWNKRWTLQSVSSLCFQLGELLQSGIPLREALLFLHGQKGPYQERFYKMVASIEQGENLSKTFSRETFPSMLISLVGMAEERGGLAETLTYCGRYYQEKLKYRQELFQTIAYPLFIMLFLVSAVILLFTVVVPRFQSLYSSMQITLPSVTLTFLEIIHFLKQYGIYFLAAVILLPVVMFLMYRWTTWLDHAPFLLLHIPGIRYLLRIQASKYIALQLGYLLEAGIPLLKSINIMRENIPWKFYLHTIEAVENQLLEGELLSEAMKKQPIFLDILSKMVSMGEQTGQLGKQLLSVGQALELEWRRVIYHSTRLIGPISLIIIGILVLIVVVTLFLPIFYLMENI